MNQTKKIKICLKRICKKIAVTREYCHGHYIVELHKGKFNTTNQICSVDICEKLTFGESQICWNHYRSQHKEGSARWKTIKQNSDLYQRTRVSAKKYKTKIRSIPKKRREENAKKRKWYSEHKAQALESLHKYRKFLTRDKIYKQNQKANAKSHFGGWENREAVVQRDGEKCIQCGTTREEHKNQWHQDLHVNHIDDYGRNVVKKTQNNSLENLETLCVKCHAIKTNLAKQKRIDDKERQAVILYGYDFTDKLKEQVRERDGRTCQDCKISERSLRQKLSIHHLNGNKKNNKLENLLSLCKMCHYKKHYEI